MPTVYTTHPRFPEHDLPAHPEHAGRIRAVWRRLDEDGLTARLNALTAQPASDEQILSVHTPQHLALLEKTSMIGQTVRLDSDTYCTPTSFELARLAAGAVTMAIDEVMTGRAANGLAAVRPPGHHAEPGTAMGFCLLGNIAIGARHAQKVHGTERVLIMDYDVHHGNGTEAMFYDDPSVLFISTHQGANDYGMPFYPGTGMVEDTGTGNGTGFTINIPLPPRHGDSSYAAIFEQIVAPAARRFKPDLILVSAGFDGHWYDPLAHIRLSLQGYADITRALIQLAGELCGGRIVFVMEGGYNLDALSNGIANIARLLLGDSDIADPIGLPDDGDTEPDIAPLLARIKSIHSL
ncbi:MAG: histone deacetylase [Chloroflexota bacterium]|nr:histone deacetylase [Chloroflexota bacterium]